MPFKSTLVNCKQCGRELPLNRIYFRRIVTNKKEHYSEICKECEKENKVNQEWKDGKLRCHICGQYKDENCFPISGHYIYRNYRDSRCTKCKGIQNKKAKDRYSDEKRLQYVLNSRLLAAKNRASSKGIEFQLSLQDLTKLWDKQGGKCAISGIPMTYELNQGRVFSNVSIDQVVPGKGYIPENIQLVCMAVNQIKSDFDMQTVLYICKQIINNYDT